MDNQVDSKRYLDKLTKLSENKIQMSFGEINNFLDENLRRLSDDQIRELKIKLLESQTEKLLKIRRERRQKDGLGISF